MAGRKITDVRESLERNKTIGNLPTHTMQGQKAFPPKQVLDICVAEGTDISMVSKKVCFSSTALLTSHIGGTDCSLAVK